MNTIPVMMTVPTAASNNQPAMKNELDLPVDSPFSQLLGGLLASQGNELAPTPSVNSPVPLLLDRLLEGQGSAGVNQANKDVPSIISELVAQLEMAGVVPSEEMMESPKAGDLLALLPSDWQQNFLEGASTEQEHPQELMADWSDLEKVLFVLLAFVKQEQQEHQATGREHQAIGGSPAGNEKLFTQLQQVLTKMFPNLQLSLRPQHAALLEDVVKHIESRLQANPKAQENGQSFLSLLTAKASSKLALPNAVISPSSTEGSTQGLNISQTGQELGQSLSRAEQATIHLGDKLPKEVQQQQFLRQFQLILHRGALTQNQQGMNSFSIKLYPEHLGRLDIQLTQIEGTIIARILTGSASTRELIEAQLAQLRQAFAQQQIPVERIEVTQQYVGEGKDDQPSQQGEQDVDQQSDETDQEETPLFQDLLNELTFNEQV